MSILWGSRQPVGEPEEKGGVKPGPGNVTGDTQV